MAKTRTSVSIIQVCGWKRLQFRAIKANLKVAKPNFQPHLESENNMNTTEFCQRADRLRTLSAKGREIIILLRTRIEQEMITLDGRRLVEHLKIVDAKPHSLLVWFYGLRIVFRIDLKFTEAGGEGYLRAFTIGSEDRPTEETNLVEDLQFDINGNVTSFTGYKWVMGKYEDDFLSAVVSVLAKRQVILRAT
jgi:hypothetical protein